MANLNEKWPPTISFTSCCCNTILLKKHSYLGWLINFKQKFLVNSYHFNSIGTNLLIRYSKRHCRTKFFFLSLENIKFQHIKNYTQNSVVGRKHYNSWKSWKHRFCNFKDFSYFLRCTVPEIFQNLQGNELPHRGYKVANLKKFKYIHTGIVIDWKLTWRVCKKVSSWLIHSSVFIKVTFISRSLSPIPNP